VILEEELFCIHFSKESSRGGEMGNGFIGRYLGIILRFREPNLIASTRGFSRPHMTRLYPVVREIIDYHKIYDSLLHNTVQTEGRR
jgi:hypothetical protein